MWYYVLFLSKLGSSWSRSYGSWLYKYLCNQCLSPLTLWVRIPRRWGVLDTTLCDKVCQWFAAGRWFSPGNPVSSTNNTERDDITKMLLKVDLNTTTLTFTPQILSYLHTSIHWPCYCTVYVASLLFLW